MKSYRLIKEYPSSPELNSIYEEILGKCGRGSGKMYKNLKKDGCCLDSRDIENQPEFWEEIVEKDYEILTYRNFITGDVNFIGQRFFSNKGYREFTKSDLYAVNSTTNKKIYSIHSVKRLSDGEVFTVGDKVRISKLQHDGSFIIDEFYFDCNGDKLLCNGKCTGNGHVSITKIEHSKKPLFTTEDGVDIFEGDVFYNTWDMKIPNKEIAVSKKKDFYNEKPNNRLYKVFSTKEAAEEYILMNKPCLSLNDIFSIYPKFKKSRFSAIKNSKCQTKHSIDLINYTKKKNGIIY